MATESAGENGNDSKDEYMEVLELMGEDEADKSEDDELEKTTSVMPSKNPNECPFCRYEPNISSQTPDGPQGLEQFTDYEKFLNHIKGDHCTFEESTHTMIINCVACAREFKLGDSRRESKVTQTVLTSLQHMKKYHKIAIPSCCPVYRCNRCQFESLASYDVTRHQRFIHRINVNLKLSEFRRKECNIYAKAYARSGENISVEEAKPARKKSLKTIMKEEEEGVAEITKMDVEEILDSGGSSSEDTEEKEIKEEKKEKPKKVDKIAPVLSRPRRKAAYQNKAVYGNKKPMSGIACYFCKEKGIESRLFNDHGNFLYHCKVRHTKQNNDYVKMKCPKCAYCYRQMKGKRTQYGVTPVILSCIQHLENKHKVPTPYFVTKYKCTACDFQSVLLSDVQKHKVKAHEKKKVICPICEKVVAKRCLATHKAKYHKPESEKEGPEMVPMDKKKPVAEAEAEEIDEDAYECPYCEQKKISCLIRNEDDLITHFRNVHSFKKDKYQSCLTCLKCDKLYFQAKAPIEKRVILVLIQHIEDKHFLPAPTFLPRFKCEQCDYKALNAHYVYKHQLELHKRGKALCPHCGKSYWNKSLARHIRDQHVNEGQKFVKERVSCPDCGKSFKEEKYLDQHIKFLHNSERYEKFKCEQCGATHRDKCELRDHMFEKHGVNPYKTGPYKCTYCNFQSLSKSRITTHKKHHYTLPDNVCGINGCAKKFTSQALLHSHRSKMHRGGKPYNCTKCPFAAKDEKHLKIHMMSHAEPKYECILCEKKFVFKAGLLRHLREIHGKKFKTIPLKIPQAKGQKVNLVNQQAQNEAEVVEACGQIAYDTTDLVSVLQSQDVNKTIVFEEYVPMGVEQQEVQVQIQHAQELKPQEGQEESGLDLITQALLDNGMAPVNPETIKSEIAESQVLIQSNEQQEVEEQVEQQQVEHTEDEVVAEVKEDNSKTVHVELAPGQTVMFKNTSDKVTRVVLMYEYLSDSGTQEIETTTQMDM